MKKKIIELMKKYKEIINYLIFGVISTILSYLSYYISINTFLSADNAIQLQIANIISWIVGVTTSYITNRRYVFESKNENKIIEIGKFFVSRIATLIIDMFIMYIGVTVLHGNDKIIKIISMIVVIIGNYIFSKLFVFKRVKNNQNKFD